MHYNKMACSLIAMMVALFSLIVNGHDNLTANSTPIIDTTDKEVEVAAGISWMVKCKSNYPITWKAYDAHFDWMPPYIKSSSFFDKLEMQYVSILTIGFTSAATVGRYYCVETSKKNQSLDEMVTEGFASRVYLFVKDFKQPLVPTYEKSPNEPYTLNEKIVVPCKPSSLDTEVELCNQDEKCLTLSAYDPTKGFIILKTSPIISKGGMLYCKCDNASYPVKILFPDDWFGIINERETIAGIDKRIAHTCNIIIIPGEKLMINVNVTLTYHSKTEIRNINSEAPNSETRFPIAAVLTSGNIHKTLHTQGCDVINVQLNVTELSDIDCYKNGVPFQFEKSSSNICAAQTILSFETHVRQHDRVLGEYQCNMKKSDETSDSSTIVFSYSIKLAVLAICRSSFYSSSYLSTNLN